MELLTVDGATKCLEWAAAYGLAGYRVVPIRPGEKRPSLEAWTEAATDNIGIIEAWWTGLYRGHGVGLLPHGNLAVIDIDGDSHGVDGESVWRELLDSYGAEEPETVEQITGGGGRHLWFEFPSPVRNGRLAEGIDIRGVGGQVLVEPTMHPNGQSYAWVEGRSPFNRRPAEAPPWLAALVRQNQQPARQERQPTPPTPGVERPGDALAAKVAWSDLLAPDGWTLHSVDGETQLWTRPGKDPRDGASASVNYRGGDALKVFTTNAAPLVADATYTRLGYLAATRFGGDTSEAARALREAGYGTPLQSTSLSDLVDPASTKVVDRADELHPDDDDGGWTIMRGESLSAILEDGYERVRPTMWQRVDGLSLLYPARSTCIAAESGTGKSWLSCHAVAEQMMAGSTCMVIDFEDHVTTYLDRFIALGVSDDVLTRRLIYVDPGIVARGGSVDARVLNLASECAVIVIDSVGEALAASGVNENSDGEVGGWFHRVIRPFERSGCAVLLIDHLPKNTENQRWAIGSQRKAAALTGALYLAHVAEPFSQERAGRVALKAAKDRHGTFAREEVVAVAHISPSLGGTRVDIELHPPPPTAENGRQLPTVLMSRVSDFLLVHPEGASGREITSGLAGKAPYVRQALDELVLAGHVERQGAGRSVRFILLTPYTEPSEKP